MKMKIKIPLRYLPSKLTRKDKQKQLKMLLKSRKLYKKNKYYTRKVVPSFTSKVSPHILNARKIYGLEHITPNIHLARKTGCSVAALKKIVQKGEGAYYSSGSRPNQTAQSWGIARLASSVTGGKAAAVDYTILDRGCDHSKKAFVLAEKAKKLYHHGQGQTKKVRI